MRRARGCLDLLRGGGWASERIACVISGFGGKGVFCRYPIQFVFFVSSAPANFDGEPVSDPTKWLARHSVSSFSFAKWESTRRCKLSPARRDAPVRAICIYRPCPRPCPRSSPPPSSKCKNSLYSSRLKTNPPPARSATSSPSLHSG